MFHFQPHFHCYYSQNRQTCFLLHFLEYLQLFMDDKVDEESLRVLLSFCLIVCQVRPGVAYKSATYKKACMRRI